MDIYIARPSPCRRRVVRRPSSVVVRRRVMRASRRGKISFNTAAFSRALFRGHYGRSDAVGRSVSRCACDAFRVRMSLYIWDAPHTEYV